MKRFLFLLFLVVIFAAGHAEATTIRAEVSPLLLPGLVQVGAPFTVDLYMNNNDAVYQLAYSMPFAFYSPDGSIIDVTHRSVTDGVGPSNSILFQNGFGNYWTIMNEWAGFGWDGALPDTINHTAASSSGWPPGLGEKLFIQFALQVDEIGTFCIDSVSIPGQEPPGKYDWLFNPPAYFGGPYCWQIGNMPTQPEIKVIPDSLVFQSMAGQAPPNPQVLNITNIGVSTLHWTATKKSSWLAVLPSYGTAPSAVQVQVITTGMSSGIYYDTITVSDPNATNNPVRVPVKLTLTEPPPAIKLAPTFFSFNAVAGSSNPPIQILEVSNTGGGILHWSAANSQSWLTVIPSSGTGSGSANLSIDITGLEFGTYYDTVLVSDPAATNTPQKAAVRLLISSSLPMLALNPNPMHVVIDIDSPVPADRQFQIYNAGAGEMNYFLQENSSRIKNLVPDSGSVPQTVTIQFDTIVCNQGQYLFDTVWVHSYEAANSPLPLGITYSCYTDPARILLSKSSVSTALYECAQGAYPPDPPNFTIYNGGKEPFDFTLTHNSSWLGLDPVSGSPPQIVTINYDYFGMAPGVYHDTIVVTADNAINSPRILPVMLTILATSMPPEITVSKNLFIFTVQENRQGPARAFDLNNRNPGCMAWQLESDIPWVNFTVDSGGGHGYPWNVTAVSNALGIMMGSYQDTAHVVSPGAVNTPVPLYFEMRVWRFRGDCDYNGRINILDISYLKNYIYLGGPAPIPFAMIGDCNCDGQINLLDITAIVNYLYRGGNPLCGNPY